MDAPAIAGNRRTGAHGRNQRPLSLRVFQRAYAGTAWRRESKRRISVNRPAPSSVRVAGFGKSGKLEACSSRRKQNVNLFDRRGKGRYPLTSDGPHPDPRRAMTRRSHRFRRRCQSGCEMVFAGREGSHRTDACADVEGSVSQPFLHALGEPLARDERAERYDQ
jgi:hypothetical protein